MVERKNRRIQDLLQVVLALAILIVINIIAQFFYTQFDMTGDKRFTLTKATTDLLKNQEEPLYVRVLLDGEFPAGFKRLQTSTREMLQKFHGINSDIEYEFDDPLQGSVDQVNGIKQQLSKEGIKPINLTVRDDDGMSQNLIYPFAIFNYGKRNVMVNLLEPQTVERSDEEALNNSISLLEYKFADAIQKLNITEKPNILFSTGNGELLDEQLASLTSSLKAFYNTGRINLDSIYRIDEAANLLIMAAPKTKVSLKNQFKIDQYIMNGGKVIWLLEKMKVSLDSISVNRFHVPPLIENDLDNMLFRYGIRLQPNLILDLECSKIPQVIGVQGGKAQTELFPWYYHPLIASKSNHPIVKNIDRINMSFPSTIDTVKTKLRIRKEVLLQSSEYSRFQMYPMRLNFEILKYPPDPAKFDKGPQNVAVLLEGEFESFFKNRVDAEMEASLKSIGSVFRDKSLPTKQLFVSDADFAKNLYDVNSSRIKPIGYNDWEKTLYGGNSDFILNAIEYMLDQNGVLASRSKEVKLRLLDKVKTKNEKLKWQIINVGMPLVFLIFFGFAFRFWRRRKFAINPS